MGTSPLDAFPFQVYCLEIVRPEPFKIYVEKLEEHLSARRTKIKARYNCNGIHRKIKCSCSVKRCIVNRCSGNRTVNMFIVGWTSKMEMVALLNRTAVSP